MAEDKDGKKNSTTSVMLIGMFSFLITIIIAGTFLFVNLNQKNASPVSNAAQVGAIGPLVSAGAEIIVNLVHSETDGENYLKVNITMEADNEKTVEELTKRVPQIRDLIIGVLSSKSKDKIEEKEGKERIRREITKVINSHLSQGRVKNVFFQDFVIQ